MTTSTPTAIQSFVDSTNAEDSQAFLATFADDAVLDDWGRVFTGRSGISSWNDSDNIGKHSRFDVVEIAPGSSVDEYVVTIEVSGEGYNGLGTLTFVVEGLLVKSLVIT